MYWMSGGLPPAIWVASFWSAESAETFSSLILMFGWSFSNWATSERRATDWPIQDWKVTVVDESGSGMLGLRFLRSSFWPIAPCCTLVSIAVLVSAGAPLSVGGGDDFFSTSLPHAASTAA